MAISPRLIDEFKAFFSGSKDSFMQWTPGPIPEAGEKREGTYQTIKETLVTKNYEEHLTGKKGLGVNPIFNIEYTNFVVIDIDLYKEPPKAIQIIDEYQLPFCVFRSKSGGFHCYLFFEEPVKALDARAVAEEFKLLLGLGKKAEIFPKQSTMKEVKVGSFINLPYFGGDQRPMVHNGEEYPLDEAIRIIRTNMQTLASLQTQLKELPFFDGPPCLQQLYMKGVDSLGKNEGRNNYLFTVARYYKIKDEQNLSEGLIDANNRLKDPLSEKELHTIEGSIRKSDSTYLCTREPMEGVCQQALCVKRPFGIAHSSVSNFSFGRMKKYTTDPPFYIWEINGKNFEFYHEKEILSQRNFQVLALRILQVAPKIIKEAAWTKIVNTAFENVEIIEVKPEDDFSDGSVFMASLVEYMEEKGDNDDPVNVMYRGCYKDKAEKRYLFKPIDFCSWLRDTKNFRMYTPQQIHRRLKDIGGESHKAYLSPEFPSVRFWSIPFASLSEWIEKKGIPIKDFLEAEEKNSEF